MAVKKLNHNIGQFHVRLGEDSILHPCVHTHIQLKILKMVQIGPESAVHEPSAVQTQS